MAAIGFGALCMLLASGTLAYLAMGWSLLLEGR
jgi:hypothetical protein